MTDVIASIVTYNPDISRLQENLRSVSRQVLSVVIVDNGSSNIASIKDLLRDFTSVHLLENPHNRGIAQALNRGIAWASASGAEWVFLLDQDTVASAGAVATLHNHCASDVALIAPRVDDRSLPPATVVGESISEVNYCITSGSLCSAVAWKKLGGYDEAMFIDFVDFDYCLRLRQRGYKIVRDPSSTILHEIGQITRHGPFTAYHYSAFRSYHMAKDMIYYAKKHRRSPREFKVQGRGLFSTYLVLMRKLFVVAIFEEQRLERVTALLRGTAAGTFRLRMPRLD